MKIEQFECIYCKELRGKNNIKKHEKGCYLNPDNLKLCLNCGKPIKNKKAVTCSYGCSNTIFRSGRKNGNWKEATYRSTCF